MSNEYDLRKYLDRFNVLKVQNTQYYLRCPSCDGKIALSKNNGKWLCVSSDCTAREVYNSIGVELPFSAKEQEVRLPVKRLKIDRELNLYKVTDYQANYDKNIYRKRDGSVLEQTTYNYGDSLKIVRYDHYYGQEQYEKGEREDKDFCIMTKEDGRWKTGGDLSKFLLFNEEYAREPGYDLVLVEGEKCAITFTSCTGILALSPPAGGWSERVLDALFRRLFWKAEGILFIPDNDEVGRKKSKIVELCASKNRIPTEIFNISKVVDEGKDIGDLLESDRSLNFLELHKKAKL